MLCGVAPVIRDGRQCGGQIYVTYQGYRQGNQCCSHLATATQWEDCAVDEGLRPTSTDHLPDVKVSDPALVEVCVHWWVEKGERRGAFACA